MGTAVSVVAALAAAAMFGTASVLQHDEASAEDPGGGFLRLSSIGRLVHRRRWRRAVALAAASFGMQALALSFGPLVLVQPLAATDLLFAMLLLAWRQRRRPSGGHAAHGTSRRPGHLAGNPGTGPAGDPAGPTGPAGDPVGGERRVRSLDWAGAALVAGGVAAFLALVPPGAGRSTPPAAAWTPVFGAIGGALVATLALGALVRTRPVARTALLAAAGAAVFSLVDALTKSVVGWIGAAGAGMFLQWEPYLLLVVGMLGTLLAQAAYQAGPLLVSLPVIDTVEPVGAVAIGATVFAEPLARSPGLLAVQLLAGAVAVSGIVLLDRSPRLAARATLGPPGEQPSHRP